MAARGSQGPVALDSPLDKVLGPFGKSLYRAFGYETVANVLEHYPRRYAYRGELTSLAALEPDEEATVIAEVTTVNLRTMQSRKGSIVEAVISDGTGFLTLTFFNQKRRADELKPGVRGMFAGKITTYRGKRQLAHPDYQLFEVQSTEAARQWAETPVPIYPATATIASWRIQKAIEELLKRLDPVDDPVPLGLRDERGLLSYQRALEAIHGPEDDVDWKRARSALRFREAFLLQTALLQRREEVKALPAEPRLATDGGYLARFDAALPFSLTEDQIATGREIANDLASAFPMNRLVQGEVGSGKTIVALRGMLAVADSGGQSVLLAPTEVLAGQHLRSITAMLGPDLSAHLMPTLITASLPSAERKRALLRIVSGQARIVIGTHALFNEQLRFYDLGLVVVDEQHRFGVEQRENLRMKARVPPHLLVLTATPIPRTVAMTVFGDLDVSTIRQLPDGRAGIETFMVPLAERPDWLARVWARVAEEVALGRQVFVVCPSITDAAEGADVPSMRSVERIFGQLSADPMLAGLRIAQLHGRLSSDEKDSIMRAFAAGDIDVLVATTVIEVGVNVPNASMMVVIDADRFGMSQLHQLRGRVGRGSIPGLCLLLTDAESGSLANQRVAAVAGTLDGFELAQIDLELRQEGDVLGTSQSGGRSSLRLLRVARDGKIIADARSAAARVLEADPALVKHSILARALQRRLDVFSRDFLGKS